MGALLLALKVYTFYGPKYANANIPHIHRVESRITGVVMVPWRNAPTIYVGAVFNGTRHAGGSRHFPKALSATQKKKAHLA